MTLWRAGCSGMGTSGPEGGQQKPISRKTGRALLSDPYTEHPTREGQGVLLRHPHTYSRREVGWSIDSSPTGALVTNALGMAIDSRLNKRPEPGTIIHSDQGVQFGCWAFTQPAKDSGLLASMGSIGDGYDSSMIGMWEVTRDVPSRMTLLMGELLRR